MRRIVLELPEAFDALMRSHLIAKGVAPPHEALIDDHARRAFIAALLAAVAEGLDHPVLAAALKRLNGLEVDDPPQVH